MPPGEINRHLHHVLHARVGLGRGRLADSSHAHALSKQDVGDDGARGVARRALAGEMAIGCAAPIEVDSGVGQTGGQRTCGLGVRTSADSGGGMRHEAPRWVYCMLCAVVQYAPCIEWHLLFLVGSHS